MDLQNVKKKVSVFRAHGHKACMYFYNHDSHVNDEGVPPFPFSSMSSIPFSSMLSIIVEHNGWDESVSDGRKDRFHYFLHLANRCYT